jgi:hypothetical protein
MEENKTTPFSDIFNSFLSKTTDDMYMELDDYDTQRLLGELLVSAIPSFEFPRVSLDYEVTATEKMNVDVQMTDENGEPYVETIEKDVVKEGFFYSQLSQEEINILATYMVVQWVGQQLASVENTRMKYSGSDFKFTSQANHMQKLIQLKNDYQKEGFHLQRLYKRRRKDSNGIMRSTMSDLYTPQHTEGGV